MNAFTGTNFFKRSMSKWVEFSGCHGLIDMYQVQKKYKNIYMRKTR